MGPTVLAVVFATAFDAIFAVTGAAGLRFTGRFAGIALLPGAATFAGGAASRLEAVHERLPGGDARHHYQGPTPGAAAQ